MNKKYLAYGAVGLVGIVAIAWFMKRRQMGAPMGMPMAQTVFA